MGLAEEERGRKEKRKKWKKEKKGESEAGQGKNELPGAWLRLTLYEFKSNDMDQVKERSIHSIHLTQTYQVKESSIHWPQSIFLVS